MVGHPKDQRRACADVGTTTTCDTPARASLTTGLTGGVPITVVSRRLGHASVSITLDVYSHVLPTDDTDAAAKVAGLILGPR